MAKTEFLLFSLTLNHYLLSADNSMYADYADYDPDFQAGPQHRDYLLLSLFFYPHTQATYKFRILSV